jgi:hypothetical protein
MEELIPLGIQAMSTAGIVYVAYLQLRAEKERKKQDAADEKDRNDREEQRQDDLSLQMATGNLICASGDLALTTSKAVTGQKTNGDVVKAQTEYLSALSNYHTKEALMAQKYLKKLSEQ